MIVRAFEPGDINTVRKIHSEYFPTLDFPDFSRDYLCAFVIGDGDSPVCVGGVRAFAESIIVTDKSKSVREKREALYRVLDISKYIASHNGFNSLHAFIEDEEYMKILLKRGFRLVNGRAVITGV